MSKNRVATNKVNDRSDNPEHWANERALVRWTKVVGFLTGGLVFVGAVTGYIFWQQLRVMQGQLNEMRFPAADRPYLFTNHDDTQAPDPEGGKLVPGKEFNFSFKNYGKGPAAYRGFQPRCGYWPTNPPVFAFTDDKWGTSIVLGAGDTIGPIGCPLVATQEQIASAEAGKGFIFIAGRLIYDDLAANMHWTIVCLIYKFPLKRFGLLPNDQGCNRHS